MVLVYASNAVITDGNFVRVSTQKLKDKQSMDNATEGLVQQRRNASGFVTKKLSITYKLLYLHV
jgi:hypothetical protein